MTNTLSTLKLIVLFLGCAVSSNAQVGTSFGQLVYDMVGEPFRSGAFGAPWGAHEGGLHGVPSNYDWADGARPGTWMDYGTNQAISTWGQVYEWSEGSPETNIRVHIANMQTYGFANGEWILLEENNIGGGNFLENFSGSANLSDVRNEASGGISVTMVEGYNYHWWINMWPRSTLPEGTEALFVTCQVRLIPNSDPDVDLSEAKYLAGVSNDYYPSPTASGPGPWPSVAITRHKFLTAEWQTFTSYVAGPEPTTVEAYRNEILSRSLPPTVAEPGAPVVRITSPVNDSLLIAPGNVAITAEASDPDGTLEMVRFLANDNLIGETSISPYEISWESPGNGVYTIKAIAFDDMGNSSLVDSIEIQISPSVPPTARITFPADGALLPAAETAIIQTDVSDPDGIIELVEFFLGTTKLGEATSSPFSLEWTDPAPGYYTLYISATDNSGVTINSEKIAFRVATDFTYEEDFGDGIAQGWKVLAGDFDVTSQGKFYTGSASEHDLAVFSDIRFSNFSYSADLNAHWNNWFGIAFNIQDDSTYYFAEISIPDKKVILKLREGSAITEIADGAIPGATSNVTYEVSISNNQGVTDVSVDGNSLISDASTPEFTEGLIGLYANFCKGDFDNIYINGTGLYYPDILLETSTGDLTFYEGDDIEITGTLTDRDGTVESYTLYFDGEMVKDDFGSSFTYTASLPAIGTHQFTAVARDNDDLTREVTIEVEVVEDLSSAGVFFTRNVRVYPNPVSGDIFTIGIDDAGTIRVIRFYTITGSLIEEITSQGTQELTFHANRFADSIYFLEIDTDKGTCLEKLIIR